MFFYSEQPDALYCEVNEKQNRFYNIGRLTAGVVHDLNNLLGSMFSTLDLLQSEAPPKMQKQLALLESTVYRAEELTDGLLALLRQSPLPPEPIDPRPCVEELCRLLAPSLDSTFHYEIEEVDCPRKIVMHRAKLGQILLNLVINAAQAAGPDGMVAVYASFDADNFVLVVQDNGSGLPLECKAAIFDPLFSTKEGTGLGLAIVKSMVEEAHGEISVESSPKGTIFGIRLPEQS